MCVNSNFKNIKRKLNHRNSRKDIKHKRVKTDICAKSFNIILEYNNRRNLIKKLNK